ncbi:MAG: NAD(P)-dependent alcohol dehydrogenase [Acidimicrobiales bacterium]
MEAIVNHRYGSPDGVRLQEVAEPPVGDDGVLVRVRAASVNPADWHLIRGEPRFSRLVFGLRRPKRVIPGMDVAGQVERVGANVKEFRRGDEVFGGPGRTFAHFVCGTEGEFVAKPATVTFEQAAAIPVAGCTALQALRDKGRLQPGQRVLINGAAGGVGTFAVQIAKALGGDVTAVCSTRNLELARSIGADHVVDYTVEDFTRSGQRYELIINTAGNRSISDLRRALTPTGTLVLVGEGVGRETGGDGVVRILAAAVQYLLISRFTKQRILMFLAKIRKEDLILLQELIEAGKVTPVIDRAYPLGETAEALRYLEAGHARGKVVLTV